MEQTVQYRGFAIQVRSDQTDAGKCRGKFEIVPETAEAKNVFSSPPVTKLAGAEIHQTSDDRKTNPEMLSNQHLIDMAQGTIDALYRKFSEVQ